MGTISQRPRPLLLLLTLSPVITSFHYTDNHRFFEQYPAPDWITAPSVYIAWITLTAIGAVGCWLYSQERFWSAYLCLSVYSLTGLTSPGHYFYGPISAFSLKMHTLIGLDFAVGLLMLIFVFWSALSAQRLDGQAKPASELQRVFQNRPGR